MALASLLNFARVLLEKCGSVILFISQVWAGLCNHTQLSSVCVWTWGGGGGGGAGRTGVFARLLATYLWWPLSRWHIF